MKTTIARSFSLVLAAILLLTVSFSALAEESTSVAIDKEVHSNPVQLSVCQHGVCDPDGGVRLSLV